MLSVHYLCVLFRVITFLLTSIGYSSIFSTFSVKLECIIVVYGYLNSCKINSIALSLIISLLIQLLSLFCLLSLFLFCCFVPIFNSYLISQIQFNFCYLVYYFIIICAHFSQTRIVWPIFSNLQTTPTITIPHQFLFRLPSNFSILHIVFQNMAYFRNS